MQKHRTGFSTLMLALSMGAAAFVNSTANAEPADDAFASDDFVFYAPLASQRDYEHDFSAPSQSSANEMWAPSADDSNAHIFSLLQYVGAIDGDGQQDYLLI